MIDLHLHLDGSLSKSDFIKLSKLSGVKLPNDWAKHINVSKNCSSLVEYLECFDLPLSLLQTKQTIKECVKSLVNHLYKISLIYGEIRFAPLLHLQQGLTLDEVANAAIEGLKEGLKGKKDFDANLIFCCMRHASHKLNLETIELANKYKDDKVCAVDLAGAENLHPSKYFKKEFNLAKKYGLNITIHAGEATGSEEIMQAIDNGAKRIGHGVHLSLDKKTIKKVIDNKVVFEFCPTSNLQTKSLKNYDDVPIVGFKNNKIPFTINSDNMTVSNTNVNKEIKTMIKTFNLSKEEVLEFLHKSAESAFIRGYLKDELHALIDKRIDKYYESLSK